MGSKPVESKADLLTIKQAANILGVTSRTVRSWCSTGRLQPVHISGGVRQTIRFRRSDILAMADTKLRNLTFPEVASIATRNQAELSTLSKIVERISFVLGLDHEPLKLDEDSVLHEYTLAKEIPDEEIEYLAEDILKWARYLYSITEEYLLLVKDYTGDEEPWRPFLMAARHLCSNAPRDEFDSDKELESAYAYMELARRHIMHVSYFFVRINNGDRIATRMFPRKDWDENVIGHLCPS